MIKLKILAKDCKKVLNILNNIIKDEDNAPFIDYPVLIGSQAAKWHIPPFREPNDWDLIATPSQTTLFIKQVKESSATFNSIKLIYYPGGGLKLIGMYNVEQFTDGKPISFDIELVSNKVDLRNMKSTNKKENDENSENESDEDVNNSDEDNSENDNNKSDDSMQDSNDHDNMQNNETNQIEFVRVNDIQPKISALMILELCRNIDDKTMLPLLLDYSCIVAPLKILEALKASHIYWPADFLKNIADLHFLRILLDYNKVSYSPQRDEPIELMLKTRIKETEIIRGKPGTHINLNMSNEDLLDNEDNLFVQRRVPHDNLHELVKYGDHPIHQGLKDDQV
jgi:hypothetical protein